MKKPLHLPPWLAAQKAAEQEIEAQEQIREQAGTNIATAFAYVETVFERMDERPEIAAMARAMLAMMEDAAFARMEGAVKRERKRRKAQVESN